MPWTLTSTPTKALPSREGLLNIGVKDNDVIIWPKLMDANWIQTVPGKGYSAMLRLYSPLEPFFTKEWRRPGEIELVP
jgi:hypothetical protein